MITIAMLDRLSERLYMRHLCDDAGVPYDRILKRMHRYRRGESYAEISASESAQIVEALARLGREIDAVIGPG